MRTRERSAAKLERLPVGLREAVAAGTDPGPQLPPACPATEPVRAEANRHPADLKSRYGLVAVRLFETQRHAEAMAAVLQALDLKPESEVAATLYLFMGRAARELGRLDTAAGHFRQAFRLNPQDVDSLLIRRDMRLRRRNKGRTDGFTPLSPPGAVSPPVPMLTDRRTLASCTVLPYICTK